MHPLCFLFCSYVYVINNLLYWHWHKTRLSMTSRASFLKELNWRHYIWNNPFRFSKLGSNHPHPLTQSSHSCKKSTFNHSLDFAEHSLIFWHSSSSTRSKNFHIRGNRNSGLPNCLQLHTGASHHFGSEMMVWYWKWRLHSILNNQGLCLGVIWHG